MGLQWDNQPNVDSLIRKIKIFQQADNIWETIRVFGTHEKFWHKVKVVPMKSKLYISKEKL